MIHFFFFLFNACIVLLGTHWRAGISGANRAAESRGWWGASWSTH